MSEFLAELFSLDGKVAVVIGGTGELCGAMGEGLAQAGAEVVLVGRSEKKAASRMASIAEKGGKSRFIAADVGSRSALNTLCNDVVAQCGRVDILVCSAGVLTGAYRGIGELSEEDWNATLDTNLKGTYLTAKHAAPLLELAGETVLLLIASGAGVHGGSSSFAYAASKAGIHGMYHNFVNDLGSKGTRVHVICPGGIATPLKLKNVAEGARARGEDAERAVEAASQNLGDPMGVARVLAFLASDDGAYVRGTVFTR